MKAAKARYEAGTGAMPWAELDAAERKRLVMAGTVGARTGSPRGEPRSPASRRAAATVAAGGEDVFSRLSSPQRRQQHQDQQQRQRQQQAGRRLQSPQGSGRRGVGERRLGSPPRSAGPKAGGGGGGDVFSRLNSPDRGSKRAARLGSPARQPAPSPAGKRLGSPARGARAAPSGGARGERLRSPPRRSLGSPARTPRASQASADPRIPGREPRERMFRQLVAAGDSFLSFAQIVVAVAELMPAVDNRPALLAAYKAADVQSDGWIGRPEFRQVLHHLVFFDERWPLFESVVTDEDHRLSPAQFCAACAHVGCPMQPADAAMHFSSMDPTGSRSLSVEQFCTWIARNPVKHVAMAPKAASPPAAPPGAAPSLQEIDELESVYAQFVNTAPATAPITPAQLKRQPAEPGMRAGASLAAISDGSSPGAGGTAVGAWGSGGDDDEQQLEALIHRSRTEQRKRGGGSGGGVRGPRSPRMASSGAPSRLVRSLVSPPRQRNRDTRTPRQIALSDRSTNGSYSRANALVSPPRGARGGGAPIWSGGGAAPTWSGNFKPFHRAESAARTLWDTSRTGMTLQEKTVRSQSHNHNGGSGKTIHDTLFALHERAQMQKDDMREKIQHQRWQAQMAECRPWDADRRAKSQGRPRVDGSDLATRALKWQKDKETKLQEKSAIFYASTVPRRETITMTAEQIAQNSERFHANGEEKRLRLEKRQSDHATKITPLFKPQLDKNSVKMAKDGKDVEQLLEWGIKRKESLAKKEQDLRDKEVAGLFNPLIDGRKLMSPERARHEHATDPSRTPRRVNRNQQAALVAKLSPPAPRGEDGLRAKPPSLKGAATAIMATNSMAKKPLKLKRAEVTKIRAVPKKKPKPVAAAAGGGQGMRGGAPRTVVEAAPTSAPAPVPVRRPVSPEPEPEPEPEPQAQPVIDDTFGDLEAALTGLIEPSSSSDGITGITTAATDEISMPATHNIATWLTGLSWMDEMDMKFTLRKMRENLIETVEDLDFIMTSAEMMGDAPYRFPEPDRLWEELRETLPENVTPPAAAAKKSIFARKRAGSYAASESKADAPEEELVAEVGVTVEAEADGELDSPRTAAAAQDFMAALDTDDDPLAAFEAMMGMDGMMPPTDMAMTSSEATAEQLAAPPTADPVALAASTAPAELAIEDLTRRTKEDLTNHMTGGLHLSGEFRDIGGQHMFDLIPGGFTSNLPQL